MQHSDNQSLFSSPNSAVLYDASNQRWLHFYNPAQTFSTQCLSEVIPLIKAVQQQVDRHHYYAVGFLSYEAAPAFDSSFKVNPDSHFPLVWFGLYRSPQIIDLPDVEDKSIALAWTPSISRQQYQQAIERIKVDIAQGHTYQVNFSFRLKSTFLTDPWRYFLQLVQSQEKHYEAFINLEQWSICSASPELFFQLENDLLTCRPMKGTASRGLTCEDDRQIAKALQTSEKNQAENLMIVDMIRNDMGRIAQLGSVQVTRLFKLEQYPTVWQMTSPVQCLTQASLIEILQALFPCASITGAPKSRTMQIIAELEDSPRQIYTGTIGFLTPNRTAQFNVAIRTVLIDKVEQVAEYGVGGGIVWDSVEANEFEECHTKAKVLTRSQPQFDLLESLLWTPAQGYFLLELHLQRLQNSASYFAFSIEIDEVQQQLERITRSLPQTPHKIRLCVLKQGEIRVEAKPIGDRSRPLSVGIAKFPIDSSNLFLYHKTTHRTLYEQAKQKYPGLDDVLLWNERGELTESCFANLIVEQDGQWYTPPVRSGLLPGTLRAWLLQQGKIQERVLHLEELQFCSRLFLANSVRQIQEAIVAHPLSTTCSNS